MSRSSNVRKNHWLPRFIIGRIAARRVTPTLHRTPAQHGRDHGPPSRSPEPGCCTNRTRDRRRRLLIVFVRRRRESVGACNWCYGFFLWERPRRKSREFPRGRHRRIKEAIRFWERASRGRNELRSDGGCVYAFGVGERRKNNESFASGKRKRQRRFDTSRGRTQPPCPNPLQTRYETAAPKRATADQTFFCFTFFVTPLTGARLG